MKLIKTLQYHVASTQNIIKSASSRLAHVIKKKSKRKHYLNSISSFFKKFASSMLYRLNGLKNRFIVKQSTQDQGNQASLEQIRRELYDQETQADMIIDIPEFPANLNVSKSMIFQEKPETKSRRHFITFEQFMEQVSLDSIVLPSQLLKKRKISKLKNFQQRLMQYQRYKANQLQNSIKKKKNQLNLSEQPLMNKTQTFAKFQLNNQETPQSLSDSELKLSAIKKVYQESLVTDDPFRDLNNSNESRSLKRKRHIESDREIQTKKVKVHKMSYSLNNSLHEFIEKGISNHDNQRLEIIQEEKINDNSQIQFNSREDLCKVETKRNEITPQKIRDNEEEKYEQSTQIKQNQVVALDNTIQIQNSFEPLIEQPTQINHSLLNQIISQASAQKKDEKLALQISTNNKTKSPVKASSLFNILQEKVATPNPIKVFNDFKAQDSAENQIEKRIEYTPYINLSTESTNQNQNELTSIELKNPLEPKIQIPSQVDQTPSQNQQSQSLLQDNKKENQIDQQKEQNILLSNAPILFSQNPSPSLFSTVETVKPSVSTQPTLFSNNLMTQSVDLQQKDIKSEPSSINLSGQTNQNQSLFSNFTPQISNNQSAPANPFNNTQGQEVQKEQSLNPFLRNPPTTMNISINQLINQNSDNKQPYLFSQPINQNQVQQQQMQQIDQPKQFTFNSQPLQNSLFSNQNQNFTPNFQQQQMMSAIPQFNSVLSSMSQQSQSSMVSQPSQFNYMPQQTMEFDHHNQFNLNNQNQNQNLLSNLFQSDQKINYQSFMPASNNFSGQQNGQSLFSVIGNTPVQSSNSQMMSSQNHTMQKKKKRVNDF